MGRSPELATSSSTSRRPSLAITSPSASLYSPGIIGHLSTSGTGFSLCGLDFSLIEKQTDLPFARQGEKPVPLNESDGAPLPALCHPEKSPPLAPRRSFPGRLP